MENITYYIGAGASYNSLPLIKTMNIRMQAFSTFLKVNKEKGLLTHKFAEKYIEELDFLIETEKSHTSIDAYAKKLSISNECDAVMKLHYLKCILCGYILFEQLIKPKEITFYSDEYEYQIKNSPRIQLENELQKHLKSHIDRRYHTFWGNYLSENVETLPNNIKLISWNYDIQFESSFSEIKNFSINLAQQKLQVFPSEIKNIDITKSCILKLNGTAGLFIDNMNNNKLIFHELRKKEFMDNMNYIISILEDNYNRAYYEPLIAFAWENSEIVLKTRQMAKSILENTTILIIIGYSFPDFNKSIDKKIFENISNLKKVYFQAPLDEIDDLIDKLDGINLSLRDKIVPIKKLETFHIPNEYF